MPDAPNAGQSRDMLLIESHATMIAMFGQFSAEFESLRTAIITCSVLMFIAGAILVSLVRTRWAAAIAAALGIIPLLMGLAAGIDVQQRMQAEITHAKQSDLTMTSQEVERLQRDGLARAAKCVSLGVTGALPQLLVALLGLAMAKRRAARRPKLAQPKTESNAYEYDRLQSET